MKTILSLQDDDFWTKATMAKLEEVRLTIRELMYCLRNEIKTKIINVTDSVLFEQEGKLFPGDDSLESYYRRANRYIEENNDKASIQKLKNNQPLLDDDWKELEQIFWNEVGTQEEYNKAAEGVALGRFVRQLTGLSAEAINAAFSEFLNAALYSEEQIQMVNCIIDWLKKHGTLQPEEMKSDEFFGGLSVPEVWGHDNNITDWQKLKEVIQAVNGNAERPAA
jgi:type I restriction enzyme R subunit